MLVKPRALAINWAISYSRGLVWCAMPGLENNQDLVSHLTGTLMTSATWAEPTAMGRGAFSANTTTSGVYWPFTNQISKITNQFSIVVWMRIDALSQFSHILTIPYSPTWSSPFYSLQYVRDNLTSNLSLAWTVGGVANTAQGLTNGHAVTGPLAMFAVTADTAGVTRFYKNGKFGEQVTRSTGGGVVDFTNKKEVTLFSHNKSDSTAESTQGVVPYAAIWNRVLTQKEIGDLYVNPFLLLKPTQLFRSVTNIYGASSVVAPPASGPQYWRSLLGVGF